MLRSTGGIHAENCPSIEFTGRIMATSNTAAQGEYDFLNAGYSVVLY